MRYDLIQSVAWPTRRIMNGGDRLVNCIVYRLISIRPEDVAVMIMTIMTVNKVCE